MTPRAHTAERLQRGWNSIETPYRSFVKFFEDFLACLHLQPPSIFTKATASLELEGRKVGNTQKSREQKINTHTIIPYFVLSQ